MATDPVVTFFFVFGFIGGLELIDRTSFALIAFASKHPPVPSWSGAASAFVLTTAISVGVGSALEEVFREELVWVRVGGGVVLLAYAAYLALVPEEDRTPPTARSAVTAAFALIFLLEIGDTTMIFTILFVVTFGLAILVFFAAALALVTVAGFSAFVGSRLGARVEPRILEKVVVLILAAAGVVTILVALFPRLFGWV
jgi:putative Ca2+/H+ antiporter (TMEM165/GDT1 family)